ncbi:molybdate ABC transporter substrate-binding protein [Histidinibacterium lentulum]|uniref:ABC transporter substrate-binding protein n=1 Tax=Histidinibacterium lentulum TaxID=2480588 RepID=A0A3N2QTD4_9RHOB|nr:substrate-binding domain-containing protein [Histidinibacterium lentulum]ROT98481.1 ABC transporter substrate-binding protein [Histidinibacterium lentulum]
MIRVLGGGAAQGIAATLAPEIEAATGLAVDGDYGPVGGMRDRIAAGEAADLVILSRSLVESLAAQGHVLADSLVDIGDVATGIAVRETDPDLSCATGDALRGALLEADGIFFPDPQQATAGIHFAGVLKRLGIHDRLSDRFRTFPGGIPAMAALARSDLVRPVGCTQVTEILGSTGVRLAGLLPPGCDLVTTYTAGVTARAARPEAARAMIAVLAAPEAAAARAAAGFAG